MRKVLAVLLILLLFPQFVVSLGQNVNSSDKATVSIDRPWYNSVKAVLWSIHPRIGRTWAAVVNPFTGECVKDVVKCYVDWLHK